MSATNSLYVTFISADLLRSFFNKTKPEMCKKWIKAYISCVYAPPGSSFLLPLLNLPLVYRYSKSTQQYWLTASTHGSSLYVVTVLYCPVAKQ